VILRIDADSAVPPYEQLRQQVTTLVVSGALPEGTRLPPIRQLAGDLGLAPGTVARAYRELEADDVVVSRGRRGTFTRSPRDMAAPTDAEHQLAEAARTYAVRARQLGSTDQAALDHVRTALGELPDHHEIDLRPVDR
jgi:GntR family transcriptional regulator